MQSTPESALSKIVGALEQSDIHIRTERALRIEWLSLHNFRSFAICGRPETLQLLNEARDVFVNGHFVATLLIALAFIEHTIIDELQSKKGNRKSPMFGKAIDMAKKERIFPGDWLARTKLLSYRRNSFAHLQDEECEHTLGTRIQSEKRHPRKILESDAKEAIELMNNFFISTLRSKDA